MKRLGLIVPMFLFYSYTIAQTANDSNDVAIGLTNYSFFYSTKFVYGTNATGPTFYMNTNGKLSMQLGLLYDFKKYIFYEQVTHIQVDTMTGINLFVPVLLHYNYFTSNKFNLFLTGGILLGGRYYLNENNKTMSTNGITLIGGTGISYRISRLLPIRASLTIRYASENIFPGIILDLPFSFNSKKCL